MNQYLTSLHEAAHILVNSLTCNLPFHSATVIQRGDVAGQVGCDVPRNPDAETAKGIIMISIAGDLAQAIALERDFDWRLLDEADKSILTEYGPVLGDGDLEEYVRSITQETAALLKDNSFKLHYLRRTLLRRGKLSGRQIRAVLRRADLIRPLVRPGVPALEPGVYESHTPNERNPTLLFRPAGTPTGLITAR